MGDSLALGGGPYHFLKEAHATPQHFVKQGNYNPYL
jgi:hypothetical protein